MRQWPIALVGLCFVLVLVTVVGSSCTAPIVVQRSGWPSEIKPLVDFIEREHGHRFRHPIPVSLLKTSSFERLVDTANALAACSGPCRSAATDDASFNLPLDRNEAKDLLGVYLRSTQSLLVRGLVLNDRTRPVVVHELTHALQDQIWPSFLTSAKSADELLARRSITEGDATLVENAFRRTQPRHGTNNTTTPANPSAYAGLSDGSAASKAVDSGADEATVSTDPHDMNSEQLFHLGRSLFPYTFGARYLELKNRDRVFLAPPGSTFDLLRDLDLAEGVGVSDASESIYPVTERNPKLDLTADSNRDTLTGASWFMSLLSRVDFDDALEATAMMAESMNHRDQPCATYEVVPAPLADVEKLTKILQIWIVGGGGSILSSMPTIRISVCSIPVATPEFADRIEETFGA